MQSGSHDMNDAENSSPRTAERLNFFLSATLSCAAQKNMVARVRNLSAGGMMVEFTVEPDPELEVGQAVVAEMRNVGKIKGEIAWTESGRHGVKFARDIDPELVRKPVAAGTGTPDYAKALIVTERSLKNIKSLKGW